MVKFDFESELAAASAENKTTGPIVIILDEAESVAGFLEQYWEPEGDRPGMVSAKARVPKSAAAELRELVSRGRAARRRAMFLKPDHSAEVAVARAEFIIGELTSSLEWLFDDGVDDQKDEQLTTLKAEHEDAGDTVAAIANRLEDWLDLAKPYRDDIAGVGDFDDALFDEGTKLVTTLRGLPPQPTAAARTEAIQERNRYLNVIANRVRIIRATARHVFRAYLGIARLAISAYGRRARAEARRAAKTKKSAETPPT